MNRSDDPGRDLVDDGVVAQVAPDAPVVLVGDAVVDPAAGGGLEQWVAQDQHEPTAGFEYPGRFVDGGVERIDVLEREAHQHAVERPVAAGERVGARPRVPGAAGTVPRRADLRRGRIEPDHLDIRAGRGGGRRAPHHSRRRARAGRRRRGERPGGGSGPRTRGRRRRRTRVATSPRDVPTAFRCRSSFTCPCRVTPRAMAQRPRGCDT